MTTRERVAQLLKAWPKIYPHAHCELDFRNPLQLLVATILSAQSTDKRVNMVTPALFRRYPTPVRPAPAHLGEPATQTPSPPPRAPRAAERLARADLGRRESPIHSTGFCRQKARSLVRMAQTVVSDFGGEIP